MADPGNSTTSLGRISAGILSVHFNISKALRTRPGEVCGTRSLHPQASPPDKNKVQGNGVIALPVHLRLEFSGQHLTPENL